jgi:RNA 2',3'-cyclic 3'-phosphodiesterase
MRLFIALDVDDAISERITLFVNSVRDFAPAARWVKPEAWHITLKFLGERPDDSLATIKQALDRVRASTTEINFRGFGFYPNRTSARVFWIGIEAGPPLAALAAAIDRQMSALGIAEEERPFSPHLTLARRAGGSGSPRWRKGDAPNRAFQRLAEKLSKLNSAFGSMMPREFFLYQSQLSPKGSKYTRLGSFRLQ